MRINDMAFRSHEIAIEKGFYKPNVEKNPLEVHALIHTEVSEATEAVRNNLPPICFPFSAVNKETPRRGITHHGLLST